MGDEFANNCVHFFNGFSTASVFDGVLCNPTKKFKIEKNRQNSSI